MGNFRRKLIKKFKGLHPKKGGNMRLAAIKKVNLIILALALFWAPLPAGALTLNEAQKLLASDGAADDQFSVSVAVDGDTAVVGAYWDDDDGSGSGSAYVFTRSGATWTQQAKLTALDGAADSRFGRCRRRHRCHWGESG